MPIRIESMFGLILRSLKPGGQGKAHQDFHITKQEAGGSVVLFKIR
jgi:hypothetical protein